MWNIPRLGIESVSPALAGGFLTTGPPKTPLRTLDINSVCVMHVNPHNNPKDWLLLFSLHFTDEKTEKMWWCAQSQTEQVPTPWQTGSQTWTLHVAAPLPHVTALGLPVTVHKKGLLRTLRCPAGPVGAGSAAACTAFFSGCSSDVWVGAVTGRAWFSGGEPPSGNTPSRARALRPKRGKQKRGWLKVL